MSGAVARKETSPATKGISTELLERIQGFLNPKDIPAADCLDAWKACLLYTSPSPRDLSTSRMPSSA